MPEHAQIYLQQAKEYDLLISKQPPLDQVLFSLESFEGKDVLDLGAGTGRLTCIIAPKAKSMIATDVSAPMLDITERKLKELELPNHLHWKTIVADHRQLPIDDNSVDVIVSGWSICYLASSNHHLWDNNLEEVMQEARRVLRPGGKIIIFETMGTGYETPCPPDFLVNYYASLEQKYGFFHNWARVDYVFENVEQAERLVRFFFGDKLVDRVVSERLVNLPECVGIWWLDTSQT